MKVCPVCNDSFADELNFCDIDGARLAREGSAQDRNKWWSLLGAGLLVGALVISAASIFLPKARVSPPVVSSESQQVPIPTKAPATESAANVTAPAVSLEPDSAATDAAAPESKKKDKGATNENVGEAAPNPKAAAIAAERGDTDSPSGDVKKSASPSPKKPETAPATKNATDARAADVATRPAQPSSELKKDQKTQPAVSKSSDKASNDKKKSDDKENKKGGFLRVFKKIFGKG